MPARQVEDERLAAHAAEGEARRRVHLWISGLVQGVFFRATTRDRARALGLDGWVRNLPDGRVEVAAEGPPAAVGELVAWCRRGPRGARVDRLEEVEEQPRGEPGGFAVTR